MLRAVHYFFYCFNRTVEDEYLRLQGAPSKLALCRPEHRLSDGRCGGVFFCFTNPVKCKWGSGLSLKRIAPPNLLQSLNLPHADRRSGLAARLLFVISP